MNIITGNLWHQPGVKCITTNGVVDSRGHLVMGAGVALQAKTLYPYLPKMLGDWVQHNGNVPALVMPAGLITIPTKHHWRNPSDLQLIIDSAHAIVRIVNHNSISQVFSPPPGCGNGGLQWPAVQAAIQSIWDQRFTVVMPTTGVPQ